MNLAKELCLSNEASKYIVSNGVKLLKERNPQLYNVLKRYNQSKAYCLLTWAVCTDYDLDEQSDPWYTFEYYVNNPSNCLWYTELLSLRLVICLIKLHQQQQTFIDDYNSIRTNLPKGFDTFESTIYDKVADIIFLYTLVDSNFKRITSKLTVNEVITILSNITFINVHLFNPFENIRIETVNSLKVLQNHYQDEN